MTPDSAPGETRDLTGVDVEVVPSGPVNGALAAPSSKSATNRLLLLAALAEGTSTLRDPLVSDDSAAMTDAVEALGTVVEREVGVWTVRGTGGRVRAPVAPIDARLSGTTLRFVSAVATLADGPVTVTGEAPLLRRPVGGLTASLRHLGADAHDVDGYPPVALGGGGLDGGTVDIDITGSTQFASAVLLAAPYARGEVRVQTFGTGAIGYIHLTVALMRTFAVTVEADAGVWRVPAGQRYQAQEVVVPYDASTAAQLFAFAVATGGRVTVTNASTAGGQPDAEIVEVFEAMGADVSRDGSSLSVVGPDRPRAVAVDLEAMPDQVCTVACLAALADDTSRIRGVGVARGHETDRLAALATELGRLGVAVDEHADGLDVHGGATSTAVRLLTYDDHRLAMAFAALGARLPGIRIAEPWCVEKTYPSFWSDVEPLGVRWRTVAG